MYETNVTYSIWYILHVELTTLTLSLSIDRYFAIALDILVVSHKVP